MAKSIPKQEQKVLGEEKRMKAKPTPQMLNPQALLDILGRARGSVDGPGGRDIIGPNDKPFTPQFIGRTMRGNIGKGPEGDAAQMSPPPKKRKGK
jgi:hypothetical protein